MNARNEYEFSVEDFGVGLDADDVRNIISKYGKSTKRDSNLFIGAMGLGWKSPLAYSSSFYFICRKDGMERKYMMYEGEDVNTIDLLSEESTSERNGVKVVVPVRWADKEAFYHKIKEQLAYFENVYFDVSANGHTIPNNFKIYRGEHFQYSELTKDKNLHICLDNVYYPIDFAKLGISAIEFPVALRFSLSDGLFPTPNREALRYTQEAKEIILAKLEKVADYFIDKYNQSIEKCDDFFKVHKYYSTKKRNVNIIEGVKMNVGYLTVFGSKTIVKPKLKGVEILNLEKLSENHYSLMREYKVINIFNRGVFKQAKRWNEYEVDLNKFTGDNFFIINKNIPEIKKKYLKDTLNKGTWHNYYFIKKDNNFRLFPVRNSYNSEIKDYYSLLGLKKIERKDWRKAIVEFQSILESIINGFKRVDDIVVPDSYVQQYKASNSRKSGGIARRQKMSGDIVVKKAVNLERFVDGKSCKFVPETWKLKDIAKIGHLVVYAHHDDQNKLDNLYGISNGAHKLTIISLSSREIKTLEDMQFTNVMTFDKFMKGNNMPFKRLVTAYLINQLKIREGSVFRKIGILKNVNSEMMNSLKKLDNYNNTYYKTYKNLYKQMLETAQKNNLFDYSIYLEYVKMEKVLNKLYFLNPLIGLINKSWNYVYYSDSVEVRMIVDLFKRHKERVNLEFYSCSTVENQ